MLEPDNRHLLVDALRPPTGMELDQAIATSFTLDLQAMLMAPVAFALFDGEDSNDINPLALLEALKRYAERITVFSQAGHISVPAKFTAVSAWLEDSVVPVKPPPGRIFHPKLWAMSFTSPEGETASRLLISSRNLTFDNSWDTFVRLDGKVAVSSQLERAMKLNQPLVAMLRALPQMAVQNVDEQRAKAIEGLIETISQTRWEQPDGVRLQRFWPLGVEGADRPDLSGDRVMVVSPFLGDKLLSSLSSSGSNHVLVSRPSSIDQIKREVIDRYANTFMLDVDKEPDADETGLAESLTTHLSGLHAKVYVVERGNRTHLYFGSANATLNAFDGNVEILVEFATDRDKLSIDSILGADGAKGSLRDLLLAYKPDSDRSDEPDPADQATSRMEHDLRRLAAKPFDLRVTQTDEGLYGAKLEWDGALSVDPECRLSVRLVSLPATTAQPVAQETRAVALGEVDVITLSSFVVFRLTTRVDGQELAVSTLVNARMTGAPPDRHARLVKSLVTNSSDLLRYLLFLLHEFDDGGDLSTLASTLAGGSEGWESTSEAPMLESMLRALARGGPTLQRVADLLDDLRSIDEVESTIPPELEALWTPVYEVWKEQNQAVLIEGEER